MVTITISGTPGSGKSTVAEILEGKLGIKYVYSGMLFRDLAKEHKMTLEEFGKFCEENSEIDQGYLKAIKHRSIELLKKNPDLSNEVEAYIKNQEIECEVIEKNLRGAVWLIQKK